MPIDLTNGVNQALITAAMSATRTCRGVTSFDYVDGQFIINYGDGCSRNITNEALAELTEEQLPLVFPTGASASTDAASRIANRVPAAPRRRSADAPQETTPEAPAITISNVLDLNNARGLRRPEDIGWWTSSRVSTNDILDRNDMAYRSEVVGSRFMRSLATIGINVPGSLNRALGHAVLHTMAPPMEDLRVLRQGNADLNTRLTSTREELEAAKRAKDEAEAKLARLEALNAAALAWKRTPNSDRTMKLEKFNAMMGVLATIR